jgi:ribokinase
MLVLGNATVDISYSVERLPVPGETLLASDRRVDAGGKGLNQAVVAHRTGVPVRFVAAVGCDQQANVILRHLEREHLSADHLLRCNVATDESLIFIAPDGENSIVSTAEASRKVTPEIASSAVDCHGVDDWLMLQGNLSRNTSEAALRRARERSIRTFVNPAPISFDYTGLWPLIDVVVLNEVESADLTKVAGHEKAAQTLRRWGCSIVIITLGRDGALFVGDEGVFRSPAPSVNVVDTTGAGDVVCGVLAAGLALGHCPKDALRSAVAAASLSVTRRGTGAAFPTSDELSALLRDPMQEGPRSDDHSRID